VLQTEPPTGPFQRLFLDGKFGHGLPAGDDTRLRFLLDTGARRLTLAEGMLRRAEADAVEYVDSGEAEIGERALIPIRDARHCMTCIAGCCWTYRTARVKFLLYEVGEGGSAIARFTVENARVLNHVVSYRREGDHFAVEEVRPPEPHEEIRSPIVGCDPVLQSCLMLADHNSAEIEPMAILVLDPDIVRAARDQLLAL